MRSDVWSRSEQGGRPENEDTCQYRQGKNAIVAVLADGLGGQGDGKAASNLACASLTHYGADGLLPGADTIQAAFTEANDTIRAQQRNDFHMKTTAVYLCIQDAQAVWAHIGDSRLYHVFQYRIADFTLDHSASQMSVVLGNITREQIPEDPGRSFLTKALGVEACKPELHQPIRLEPGRHAFLLCSDGLWEYLTDSDIVACCQKAANAQMCCDMLFEIKDSRCTPDCDNCTAMVIFWEV